MADLVTLAILKTRLQVPSSDTSQDATLSALITQVSALVEADLHRTFAQTNYTEVYEGTGSQWLPLRQKPLLASCVAATTTLDSAILPYTGTAGTLAVGMATSDSQGVIPSGATINSIGSGSVTLSAVALGTGATQVTFGVSVWEDLSAAYGSGFTPFAPTCLLLPGVDYAPRLEQNGIGQGGMLFRINGTWVRPLVRQGGSLARSIPGPLYGNGNYLVCYTAGYATVPADVQMAVCDVVGMAWASSPLGVIATSQGYEGYSYSLQLASQTSWMGYLNGGGGNTLASYRRIPV